MPKYTFNRMHKHLFFPQGISIILFQNIWFSHLEGTSLWKITKQDFKGKTIWHVAQMKQYCKSISQIQASEISMSNYFLEAAPHRTYSRCQITPYLGKHYFISFPGRIYTTLQINLNVLNWTASHGYHLSNQEPQQMMEIQI